MGRALIDLVRARHAPSRLSTAWAAAARLTPAERLARDASLRWERAAAELEDLIRARRPAREPRAAYLEVDPDPTGVDAPQVAPETARGRAARAGTGRWEPVRGGRLVDATEAWPRGGLRDREDIAADAIEERRWFREPAGSVPPGIARPQLADPASVEPGTDRGGEPLPEWPLASRRLGPSAGIHDAGTGAAAGRTDPGLPLEPGAGLEPMPSGLVPVPDRSSGVGRGEDLRWLPRREAEPGPRASPARNALSERLPAPGDVHRALQREHGPVTPAGAGRHPGCPETPGLRLDILLEDARRRAESIEDWEATSF
jgi:hypothetical protein